MSDTAHDVLARQEAWQMIPPSGRDSLRVREAYLRQRYQRRQFRDRGWITFWVLLGVVTMWLFVAAFAGLAR